jgi:ubiquilin
MMANPEVQALIEANPEMAQALQDPEHLRQTMRMARDPRLRQEFSRIHDRQMANVNAIPGGFNHLHRMHQQMEGPLRDAAERGPSTPSTPAAATATPTRSTTEGPRALGEADASNPFIVR